MDSYRFCITFWGPFRSATGKAGRGFDVTVDEEHPLSGSHIKGLMRNAACEVLGRDHDLVRAVFGTPAQPSPWHWGRVVIDDDYQIMGRSRIQIDHDTHTVAQEALMNAEEVWSSGASFTVERMAFVDPDDVSDHKAVLLASAAMVHGVGGNRRRGFGWVGILGPDDEGALRRFKELACADG